MKRKHLAVLLSIALAASTTLPAMAAVNSGQNSRTERVDKPLGRHLRNSARIATSSDFVEIATSSDSDGGDLTILSFKPLKKETYEFTEKPELSDLLEQFPSRLTAVVRDESRENSKKSTARIDVEWECFDDYEETEYAEYVFAPIPDLEGYELATEELPEILVTIRDNEELEEMVLTAEADGTTVTVTADPGVLPEGVSLKVKRLTAEHDTETASATVNQLRQEEQAAAVQDMELFDLTLWDSEGQQIQPDTSKGELRVAFSNLRLEETADQQDLMIYHFEDDTESPAEEVDTYIDNGALTCTAEHFSVYAVVLADGDMAASIDGTEYSTLPAAVTAAQDGDTIELLTDVILTESLHINADNITLEGNGHSISGSATSRQSFIYVDTDEAFTMHDCIITPSQTVEFNPAINLKVGGTVSITDCVFGKEGDDAVMYNGLEFSQTDGYSMADGSEICNNTFYGDSFRHNCISFYQLEENAVIDISDNRFIDLNWDTTNAIRVSNYGSNTAAINLERNVYSAHGSETNTAWAGLLIFQNNKGSCANLTVNIIDLEINGKTANQNHPGTADQVFYVYENETLIPNVIFGEGIASIDGTSYSSLENAFAKAEDGDTIVLLADIESVTSIPVNNSRSLTLDLNGHSISFAKNQHFNIQGGALEVTGQGTVKEAEPYYAPVMLWGTSEQKEDYSTVIIGEDVTLIGWSPVFFTGNSGSDYGTSAEIYGTLISKTDNEGTTGSGVYVNGTIKNTSGPVPSIYIGKDAKIESEGLGLYLAGYADTTIGGNADITGAEGGLEIRAGNLTVEDSPSITGTAAPTESDPNGNGSTTIGTGIAVAQHTTKLPIHVNISGGTISGYTALIQNNPQGNDSSAIDLISLAISGGEFHSINGGSCAVLSTDKTGFITGGYFSHDPSPAYLAEGYQTGLNADGMYEVFETDEASFYLMADGKEVPNGATLQLDANESSESVRNTVELSVSSMLYGPYAWSLDNQTTAELTDNNDGSVTVTARSAGTATITVTSSTTGMTVKVSLVIIDSSLNAESGSQPSEIVISISQPDIPAVDGSLTEEQESKLEADKDSLINTLEEDLTGNKAVQDYTVKISGNIVASMMDKGHLAEGQKAIISTQQELKDVSMNVSVVYKKDENGEIILDENGSKVVESITPYIEKMTYDIHATYALEDLDGHPIQKASPFDLDGAFSITFRIPIPASVETRYADVEHVHSEGTDSFQKTIQKGSDGGSYIEITTDHFSEFILTFTNTKKTSGSSTSSGSSGGSGSTSTISRHPEGSWQEDMIGWRFKTYEGPYATNCWKYLTWNGQSEWYHFDENGYMQTGWFTDVDGNIYYLYPVPDGTRGRMLTGWQTIDGKMYYFNTVSDGTRGALYVNRQTPDGYLVGADGARIAQ